MAHATIATTKDPTIVRKSLVDVTGVILDGSVTGVGREHERTNRYPEARKTLRNRPQRASKNRIEPHNSVYESEGRRFESCRARSSNSCICR